MQTAEKQLTDQQVFDLLTTLTGAKSTIFKYGEMGFANSLLCTITKVYRDNYAQFNNCIHVNYIPKGKRTTYVWRVFYYQTFAVWTGHVALNTDMFVSEEKKSDGTVLSTSLFSFSSGYLDRALVSTTQEPLIIQRKD